MKILFILIVVAAGGVILFFNLAKNQEETPSQFTQTPTPQTQEAVDLKASFAIYTNNTFRIFTAPMYHNLSEDVFIRASNPNVVRVAKAGVTWNDFFQTLPMKLNSNCLTTGTGQTFCTGSNGTLKFYLNGKKIDNFLELEIKESDKALITFGNENEDHIQIQLERVQTIN